VFYEYLTVKLGALDYEVFGLVLAIRGIG